MDRWLPFGNKILLSQKFCASATYFHKIIIIYVSSVGLHNDQVLVNPTRKDMQTSVLDLIVTATQRNLIVMLEGKANIVPQTALLHAIKVGTKECQKIIGAIDELRKACGKEKQVIEPIAPINEEIMESVRSLCEMRLKEIFRDHSHDKMSRDRAVWAIRDDVVDKVWSKNAENDQCSPAIIKESFNKISKRIFREIIFENERCDGRNHEQLRNISCEVDMYKPLHGCSLFQRGQTQVLSTVSLDSVESALKLDNLSSIEM